MLLCFSNLSTKVTGSDKISSHRKGGIYIISITSIILKEVSMLGSVHAIQFLDPITFPALFQFIEMLMYMTLEFE